MWEIERDGVNERNKRGKRRQLGHQHLAHQSFCQQSKRCHQNVCFFVELWLPVDHGVGPRAETEAFNGVRFKSPNHKAFNVVAKLLYANLND